VNAALSVLKLLGCPCNDILQYTFARPGNHPNHEDSQSTEKKVSVSGMKKKSFLEI
jgi:hypothetical protein